MYAAPVETCTMGEPITQTMGDYCRPTSTSQVSLGFIPATPVNFHIKYSVLLGLRDKQFDGNANNYPGEHLARFYETTSMCQPKGITEDQVKLKLFSFSLIGRANDWLLCLPNGVIRTWRELEDKFLKRFFTTTQYKNKNWKDIVWTSRDWISLWCLGEV